MLHSRRINQGGKRVVYGLLWIAFAGLAAYGAAQKGRSVVWWFLLALLFPILAHVVLWVLNPIGIDDQKSREIASKFGVSARYRKCPACAEVVLKEAVKCRFCQTDLGPVPE